MIAGVIGLAAIVRVFGIGDVGYNTDEAVYAGQAAGIAQEPGLSAVFPIFRAHPLLVQSTLGAMYAVGGVTEATGRLLSAVWGVGTVILVWWIGTSLYGRRTGLLAALFIAVVPYHVIVSRQVLLDGPMTFLTTLTLGLLGAYVHVPKARYLVAAGASLGLAILAKETAIVFVAAIFAFFALSPEVKLKAWSLVAALFVTGLVVSAFPLSLVLTGGQTQTAGQYLLWQFFRRPNHDLLFYASVVPWAIGPLLLLAALLALWLMRAGFGARERLLLTWAVVPTVFFELWPTKGYQYLLPVAPVVAIFGARLIANLPLFIKVRHATWAGTAIILVSLLIPTSSTILSAGSASGLAGTGGIPGGREAGSWVRANVGDDERLMTIGPSMGNILQFYGLRPTQALAVSPNPLHRNPSYIPIRNPDLSLREGRFRYLVWDAFSASRSPHFGGRLLEYVRRFDGTLAAEFPSTDNALIRIYRMPTDPSSVPDANPPFAVRRPAAIFVAYGLAAQLALTLIGLAFFDLRRRSAEADQRASAGNRGNAEWPA